MEWALGVAVIAVAVVAAAYAFVPSFQEAMRGAAGGFSTLLASGGLAS